MTIFDASSLFNLHNGGLLPVVVSLPRIAIAFGPQVHHECRSISEQLNQLIADGVAILLSDDDVPFARFAALSAKYELGAGETECLALAGHFGCGVCCDDLRARRMVSNEIGPDRLTGSIGIVQMAFRVGLIDER